MDSDLLQGLLSIHSEAEGFSSLRECARLRLFDAALSWAAAADAPALSPLRRQLARLHGDLRDGKASLAGRLTLLAAVGRWGEVDDIHLESCTTPGAAVCSTVIALAPEADCADAGTVLDAVTAGYEAMITLASALGGPRLLQKGVWPSRHVAPIGAAMAAAVLLGLDLRAAREALVLAATWSCDLRLPEPGRVLTFGEAVVQGAAAALAAASGLRGVEGAFTGRYGSSGSAVTLSREHAGRAEAVRSTTVKPFSGARQTLAGVQGVLELVEAEDLDRRDVEWVEVAVPPPHREMVDRTDIRTRLDALTSMQCQIATALEHPESLFDLDRDLAAVAGLEKLRRRVIVRPDEALLVDYPRRWMASVTVGTRGGSQLHRVSDGGGPSSPASWQTLHEKGVRLIERVGRQSSVVADLEAVARESASPKALARLADLAMPNA